jgi:5-methylcytosine-specific restriction endonuclease McrA
MAVRGPKILPYSPCAVEGCTNTTNRRYKKVFYCDLHRRRIRDFGTPEPEHLRPIDPTQPITCRACGIEKPPSEFGSAPHLRGGKDKTCKPCRNARGRRSAARLTERLSQAIPTGVPARIPPYRLRNPKIQVPPAPKKKIKRRCKADGCERQTRINVSFCAKHEYFLKKFQSLSPPETLTCAFCGESKPYGDFVINGDYRIHPHVKCRGCVEISRKENNRRKRNNQKKDPVKWAARQRIQNKRKQDRIKNDPVKLADKRLRHRVYLNNRRARRENAGGTHTKQDVAQLLELQKNKCAACKKALRGKHHVDHVVPIARGGGSGRDNLQLLCPKCNRAKCAKDPHEFMQEMGYLL